jgi:hypothetical protein
MEVALPSQESMSVQPLRKLSNLVLRSGLMERSRAGIT